MLAFAQLLTFVSLLLAFAECVFNAQQLNKYAACARTSSDVRALDPQPSARSWRDVETSELDFTVLNVYRDGAMPLLVALSLSNSSACEASRGAACQAELHIGTLVLSANNVEFLAISAINVDVVRPGVVEQPLSIVNIGDANGDSVDEFAVFSVQFLHSGAATRTCVRIGSVRVDNAGSSLTATLSPPVPVDRLFLESAQCANFTLDSESPGADAALVLTSPTRPPALQLVAPDLSRGAVNDALYVGFPAARAVYAYDVVGTADASLLSPCTVFRSPRLLRSEPEVPGFGARVFQMQMHTDVNGLLVIDQAGGRHAFRIDGNVTSSLPEPTAVEAANIVGSSGSSLRVLAVAQDSDGNGVDELFVGLTVSEVASAAAADGSFDGALLPPKRAFLSQWFTTPFVKNVTGVRWSGGAMGAQFFGKILDQSVIRTRANMNPYSKLTRAASVNATAPNRAVHIVSYRAANGRPLLGFVPASVMTSDDLTCLGNVESSLLSLAERSPLPARIGTAVARLDLFLPPSTVHLQWVDETTGLLVAFSDRASLAYLIVARRTEPHFALVDDMLAREPETYGVRLAAMVDGNVFFVDSTGHQIWFEEIDAHSEPNDSLPFLDIVRHNELVLTNVTAGHVIGLRHVPFQRTEHARLFPRDTRPFGIDNLTATDTELLASATLSGVTLRDDANVLALVVAEKNLSLFYHLSLTNPSDPNRQAPLIAAVERPLDAMWTGDRMYVIVTDSRGVSVFNATYGYVMHVAFGTGHAHIQFTWRRGQFEDIYFVEGGYIFRLEYAMGQFDPNGSPVFTLRRRLTIPQDEIVADMALCPSGLVSYVLTTSGSLHLLWRYSDTDHWMLMTSSPVLHAVAGASSLLLATGGDRMFVAVQGGLVVVADTCKETILAPPTTSMTSSELTSPSGTSTHAAVTAEHSERLSTGASLAILAAAFVCCCFVLLPLMLCAALRMSARARRRSSELLRSVLPSGMIGTAADNNDGDGDYQLDDMTQLTRPRTSVTGRSEASLTGVWTRHARTIDGNQSWTDKIGGRVVSDTTDDIILVSHDQPWTTVDEGTMLANRSARSSTLTSITDIANALESSALTSQQKAMVRRFGWTNNIATVMKGSQYRDLESLFLLEAKSFRETSSSQRPSRDGVGARQSVGGAGSPPTPPRRSRDGAMARLTAGGAVPLPPRPTPAADYQVAVVNELLARQPSQMRWNRQESRTPTLRMSKTHLDFGLAIDELAPTQRTLVDQIEFHNDGKRALLIATPIISSPSFTLTFAPGVLTVPPKSSGVVSVALTLTRPTSIYELVDLVVCDLATVFVTIVLDAKLQSDIDPKALRFGVQKSRTEHSRTFEALYAGYKCAVKVMHDADEFRNEDGLLRSVPEHRTLLKFIGSCEVGATGIEPYCGMIVTELVEYGSLADVVHNVLRSISFRLYLRIASDVATALVYLHDGGFVHGALRPSNVMLLSLSARGEFVAKLQDYGASPQERLIVSQSRGDPVARTLPPEASLYAAPEALADPPRFSAASDVFSYGLVLFESFARQLPYLGADSLYDVTVAKREGQAPGSALPGAPEALARLIAGCLAPRARKRVALDRINDDLGRLVAATESGAVVVEPMMPNDRTTVDITTAYRSLNDQEPVRVAQEHVLLPESDLTVSDVIGRGAFGDVYQGLWRKTVPVAIKTMRSDLTKPEDLNELLAEANLLMSLPAHPCIVIVYGICQPSTVNSLWLIMELLENGSLLRLLRSAPHNGGAHAIGVVEMVGIAQDIVSGMLHLQSNGIIHRDLAARNVLIGSRTDSGYRAKVSDFGLSRQGHAYYFNPNDQKKRPVKWTAPEALAYNRYSAASDVWSFGIVLWEMSSHGMDPYPTMTVQEVFAAVQRGYRLERPPSCPDFMSDAMQACWASDPHERPTWNSLLDSLCDLSEDDVLALLVASPPSSSNQINETLARGRELRRASKASVRVTKSAVPYSFANRETNVVSAETTEDDAFDSTRLSLSIGSTPRRRDTVEPADSNPLPAAADDQSNDDEAADESSDTSDPDNDFTPAPAPLPQRGGTMALIVDDSNYIVTAPVGATVKLSTTVVLPPSAMAAAAPAAVPAMAPVVPSVQRPAFVEVPDASNYIVASAAAVPFSASRNVGPVRALNESGGKFVRKIGPTTGRSLVDSTSDDELVQTKSSGRRAGRLGPVDDSSATSDDDSMFARGLNSTAKPRGFTVSHVVDGGSTRPWVSTGNSVGSAPSMSSAPLSTSPTPTTVQVASPMASAPSSRRNSKAPSIMFDLSKRPSSPQINAPVRASSDQGRAGIDESSSESDLAGRVTAPKPTGVKGVRFGELMNSYQ